MSALDFYGLSHLPFSEDADTVSDRFDSHDLTQAVAVTQIAARDTGIGLLTGPAGVGISYSAYCARKNLDGARHTICYYPVCHITPRDFYKGLCRITGAEPKEKGREALISSIRERVQTLKNQGRPLFLFLDKAQNIPDAILQDIPTILLGDYGVGRMMGLMLCGTNELRNRIRSEFGETLQQLICSHYSFHGLNREECRSYVLQSIVSAGGTEDMVTQDVLNALYETSFMGNFRTLKNLMRDMIRLGAQEKRTAIDMEILRFAAGHLTF